MYANCTKALCLIFGIFGCCLLCGAQDTSTQGFANPSTGIGGAVTCPYIEPTLPKPVDLLTIPPDLKPRADKKARLLKLLAESLHDEATAVNDVKKKEGSIINAKRESEIRELSKQLAKE